MGEWGEREWMRSETSFSQPPTTRTQASHFTKPNGTHSPSFNIKIYLASLREEQEVEDWVGKWMKKMSETCRFIEHV
jgi:hypothetical protein